MISHVSRRDVHIWLAAEEYAALEALAARECRSISGQARLMLWRALDEDRLAAGLDARRQS